MATRRRARSRPAAQTGGPPPSEPAPILSAPSVEPVTPPSRDVPPEPDDRRENIAIVCAILAVAIAVIALIPPLSYAGWSPTVLVHISKGSPLYGVAHEVDPNFVGVSDWATYDGQVYYALARDPIGIGRVHTVAPWAAYRYEHPGYSWLAYLASFGRPELLPDAMVWVNVGLFALSAYLLSRVAVELGRSPWWGLLSAFNPGLIVALTLDTTEITLAATVLLGLLLWQRRHPLAGVAIAAACFAKELGWALPVGIGLVEVAVVARRWYPELLVSPLRNWGNTLAMAARGSGVVRRLALLLAGPLLSSLWFAYVDLVIAANEPNIYHPTPARALLAIPLRLLPVLAVWCLPLLAMLGLALLRRPAAVRLRRFGSRPALLSVLVVAVLLPVFALATAHSGSLQLRVQRADVGGEGIVQNVARRFGFQYYDLIPVAGIAQAVFGDAFDSRLDGSDAIFAIGMLPVALAVTGVFLMGLLVSLRLRTIPDALVLVTALPVLSLYPPALRYPHDLLRTLALPLIFLILMFADRANPPVQEPTPSQGSLVSL